MEIELNFRLDENGRTSKPTETSDSSTSQIDYQPKTIFTNLMPAPSKSSSHQQWLDDLLFDCQISDSGLMPRTFWMPAKGMKPRCHLEQLALDIFHHHVPSDLDYDVSTSGAEWWAQIRPSPEGTGRYSMHDDQPDELSRTGISFHWDKDEDLRLLTGGSTYIHPHLSTVTYLTDLGGPTLALNHRVHSLSGEWMVPPSVEGFVSWPSTGKHLSFDGRYLHAAPADLMDDGEWERQLELPELHAQDESTRMQEERIVKRRHRRVTFLVNVWLNYKPFDIQPFPDTMIDKLSGAEETTRKTLEFVNNDQMSRITETKHMTSSDSTQPQHRCFTWPMGDCDSKEFIEAHMPLQDIRKQASKGGNIQIYWEPNPEIKYSGVRLYKETNEIAEGEEKRKACESGLEDHDDGVKRNKVLEG